MNTKLSIEKIKILRNIAAGSLVIGLIFCFINGFMGGLLILAYFVITGFLLVKYPSEMKTINQQDTKNIKQTMPDISKNNIQFFNIEHISGIEDVKHKEKCELCSSFNEFTFYNKKDDFVSSIKFDEIKKCVIYQEIEQECKKKSPVCRTIAGGILLGPVGAVVGGVSGMIPTIKEHKKYYLEFEHADSELFDNIVISADYKTLKQIKNMIVTKE